MSSQSILQAALQMTFIGPRIAWRIMEMAAAATQVVPARTEILSAALKNPNRAAAVETVQMVSEKFMGSWESMSAAAAAAIGGAPQNMRHAISGRSHVDDLSKVLSSRNPLSWIINQSTLQINLMKALLLFSTQAPLFGFHLFMQSSEPLHTRVTANAKRLNRPVRSKRQ